MCASSSRQEEREVSDFGEARRQREEARAALKSKERAEAGLVYQRLAQTISSEETKRRESQKLRDELCYEEQSHQLRLGSEARARRQMEARQELRSAQTQQIEMKSDALRRAREDEARAPSTWSTSCSFAFA